ncbi:TIGR03668 family PPOX class F420-dependent oxidoreductase [Saccharopolyspora griseoalba]|uniref:TIGR03668 family PPOX class F420-dependent oxidoreductase n=1 Tax=Saccharopolyspora griseoalba TaxID=1431848 RepID=A0ABW2LGN2_9PSEU
MRISHQQARARFAEARTAHLATAGTDSVPHLVPVVFVTVGDRIATAVDWKPKSGRRLRRLTNIEANPRVALLVDHYDEDWSRLWWARADGSAEVHAPEARPELRSALIEKYPQYQREPPTGELIVVEVTRWTGWSATT